MTKSPTNSKRGQPARQTTRNVAFSPSGASGPSKISKRQPFRRYTHRSKTDASKLRSSVIPEPLIEIQVVRGLTESSDHKEFNGATPNLPQAAALSKNAETTTPAVAAPQNITNAKSGRRQSRRRIATPPPLCSASITGATGSCPAIASAPAKGGRSVQAQPPAQSGELSPCLFFLPHRIS